MKVQALIVEGIEGLCAGARFYVRSGCGVTIGRSAVCEVSLRDLPGFQKMPEAERGQDRAFLAISRRHLKIAVINPDHVELEAVGRHGTLLDGREFGSAILTDVRETPHTLRLAGRETFKLQWAEVDDSEVAVKGSPVT